MADSIHPEFKRRVEDWAVIKATGSGCECRELLKKYVALTVINELWQGGPVPEPIVTKFAAWAMTDEEWKVIERLRHEIYYG